MRRKLIDIVAVFILAFSGAFYSCITDEFRIKDLSIKEEWEIGIITPLFTGNLEFRDFIHDWKKPVPDLPGPKVVLDFKDSDDITIPVKMIFDPSIVIDSFPFFIQGSYEFTAVDLTFTVENSCPFPLNLELHFYEKKEWPNFGPPVLPPPFDAADFTVLPVKPKQTTYTLTLTQDQMAYFKAGKHVLMKAWYNDNGYLVGDSISAHYPVKVFILLTGKVKAKQDG